MKLDVKNTKANQVSLHVEGIERSVHHHLRTQTTTALEPTDEGHLRHHHHLNTFESKVKITTIDNGM
jgi:hypothetical protein